MCYMKFCFSIYFFFIACLHVDAQRLHVILNAGTSNYLGDLSAKVIDSKQTNMSFGIGAKYEITDNLFARAGFAFGKVEGNDAFSSKTDILNRNLSFQSSIQEFSVGGEYYLLNLYDHKITPYVFAGLGVFHFNPYAFDVNNQKVFLKPLSTEGQGLAQYPDKKEYSLFQLNIPFGGGIKFALSENIHIGIEFGLRKLFTDYLDDVSGSYVDETTLRNAKGQRAVDLAYRGDEVPGGNPIYPADGIGRGNPQIDDWYSFNGLTLNIRLDPTSGIFQGRYTRKLKLGCPALAY
jgi:opacity protein-like surface antigen